MADHYPKRQRTPLAATEAPARHVVAPPPLDDAEAQRVAAMRAAFLERTPELLPFFKALYAQGSIDGWRAVVSVSDNIEGGFSEPAEWPVISGDDPSATPPPGRG